MLRVGLTGGIGSGKSEVARRLRELGAVVIDSDELARAAVAPGTAGFDAVVREFGRKVVRDDGELDRAALASIVFADPDALARLTTIVHPLVRDAARELTAAAPNDAVVVQDVPLLVEAGLAAEYDVVVVVATSTEQQLRRLVEQRGMSEDDARARIAAQAPLEAKIAVADHVISNDGSLADLQAEVGRIWEQLLQSA